MNVSNSDIRVFQELVHSGFVNYFFEGVRFPTAISYQHQKLHIKSKESCNLLLVSLNAPFLCYACISSTKSEHNPKKHYIKVVYTSKKKKKNRPQ